MPGKTLAAARAAAAQAAPIIVFGPMCCGKTHNRDKLKEAIGCRRVRDDWELRTPLARGRLHLSNQVRADDRAMLEAKGAAVFAFADLARDLGLELWSAEKPKAARAQERPAGVALPRDLARASDAELKECWQASLEAANRPAYERVTAEMQRRVEPGKAALERRAKMSYEAARLLVGGAA